jgi:hypothetical protein
MPTSSEWAFEFYSWEKAVAKNKYISPSSLPGKLFL